MKCNNRPCSRSQRVNLPLPRFRLFREQGEFKLQIRGGKRKVRANVHVPERLMPIRGFLPAQLDGVSVEKRTRVLFAVETARANAPPGARKVPQEVTCERHGDCRRNDCQVKFKLPKHPDKRAEGFCFDPASGQKLTFIIVHHLVQQAVMKHNSVVDRTCQEDKPGAGKPGAQCAKKRNNTEHIPQLVMLSDNENAPDPGCVNRGVPAGTHNRPCQPDGQLLEPPFTSIKQEGE